MQVFFQKIFCHFFYHIHLLQFFSKMDKQLKNTFVPFQKQLFALLRFFLSLHSVFTI